MANCNSVTNLNFLGNCTKLNEVSASWASKLTDISVLKGLGRLKRLDFRDTGITSIAVLKGKEHLVDLNISGTAVTDISVLASCWNLQSVQLSKTTIEDLSALLEVDTLNRLQVSKTLALEQVDAVKRPSPDAG